MRLNTELDVRSAKWHLFVRQGIDAGCVIALHEGEPIRVGSGLDNQLSLKDPAVSTHHLVVRLESDGVHLSDLHAAPRTAIGNVRVSDAVLTPGTQVRLGGTVLEIQRTPDVDAHDRSTDGVADGNVDCASEAPPPRPYGDARRDAILAFEARYLTDLVRLAGGNASHAARIAQMDRPHLLRLLRKHQLRSPSAASTLPPHSQVVVREDAPTDASELLTSEARAFAVGAPDQGFAAPRLPRIDYAGRD